jgi:hypothetical protein
MSYIQKSIEYNIPVNPIPRLKRILTFCQRLSVPYPTRVGPEVLPILKFSDFRIFVQTLSGEWPSLKIQNPKCIDNQKVLD